MTPTERLILYGIKHLIDRETFTPELRKEMDKDICDKIVNLINPKMKEETCCDMPKRILTKEEEEELYNDGKSLFANVSNSEESK